MGDVPEAGVSADGGMSSMNLYATLGLCPEDVDALAQIPESEISVETLPLLIMQLKTKRLKEQEEKQRREQQKDSPPPKRKKQEDGPTSDVPRKSNSREADYKREEKSEKEGKRESDYARPSKDQVYDFQGTMPKKFPHKCTLCACSVNSKMTWIDHLNGRTHKEEKRKLVHKYPEWGRRQPEYRQMRREEDEEERRGLRPSSVRKRTRSPESESRGSRYDRFDSRKVVRANYKLGTKVVVMKFPGDGFDSEELLDLARPFGKVAQHLVLAQKSFIEFSSHREAKDMVDHFRFTPLYVKGQKVSVYLSATLCEIEVRWCIGPTVFFQDLPTGDQELIETEVVEVCKMFGEVKSSNFSGTEALIEMADKEDAEIMVKYYKINPLFINTKRVIVGFAPAKKKDRESSPDHSSTSSRRAESSKSLSSGDNSKEAGKTSKDKDKGNAAEQPAKDSIGQGKSQPGPSASWDREEQEDKEAEEDEGMMIEDEKGLLDDVDTETCAVEFVDSEKSECLTNVSSTAAKGEDDKEPDPESDELSVEKKELSAEKNEPIADDGEPSADKSEPSADNSEPSADKSEPPAEENELSTNKSEPSVEKNELSTDTDEKAACVPSLSDPEAAAAGDPAVCDAGASTEDMKEQQSSHEDDEPMDDDDFPDNLDDFVTLDEIDTVEDKYESSGEEMEGGKVVKIAYHGRNAYNFKLSGPMALAEPFGGAVRFVKNYHQNEVQLELRSPEQARAMVEALQGRKAHVAGRPVTVSLCTRQRELERPSGRSVFISNLPSQTGDHYRKYSKSDVMQLAYPFGNVTSYHLNYSSRVCFIQMESEEAADKMLNKYACKTTRFYGSILKFSMMNKPDSTINWHTNGLEYQWRANRLQEEDQKRRRREEDREEERKNIQAYRAKYESEKLNGQSGKSSSAQRVPAGKDGRTPDLEGVCGDSDADKATAAANDPEDTDKTPEEPLDPYNSDSPVGLNFLVERSGLFCRLCKIFYTNDKTARDVHCCSEGHYQNMKKKMEGETPASAAPTSFD